MNIDDMKVYVTTSNNYVHIVKVFSYLFNKFWNAKKEVIVVGFEKEPDFDMPDNFSFISLGSQTYPYVDFSHDMRLFLDVVGEDYFINFEENEFIIKPVNFDILDQFQSHINPGLGRIDFTRGTSDRSHQIVKKTDKYDIICAAQDAELRMCIRGGIWNKNYLLDHCQDEVSTYNWEAVASGKSKNDGFSIISSNRDWVIRNMDGVHYRTGQQLTDLRCLGEQGPMGRDSSWGVPLDDETISELVSLEYVKPLSNGLFEIKKDS
tara:strand:- start:72 stop:863 length:792 start_codon:yes stop_codon:yes gene_type:complete